jgi:hypothetical protein
MASIIASLRYVVTFINDDDVPIALFQVCTIFIVLLEGI